MFWVAERSLYQDYFHELPKQISKEAYEDVMYKIPYRNHVIMLKDNTVTKEVVFSSYI